MLQRINLFYALVLGSLLMINQSCTSKGEGGPQRPNSIALPTVKVQSQNLISHHSYPATIEGTVNSAVRAKVSGYITEVLVDEGAQVKKDQVLFRLETQSLTEDAQAAKARVDAAKVEVEKLKPLVDQGIISAMQLETAKADLATAKSNYNAIIANIDYANIKSPVDGVLGKINYRKGALVSPADQMPITTVSAINSVYANFSMNEKEYLDFIERGLGKTSAERIDAMPEVTLILANGSPYSEKGKIETVSGQVNKVTGTVGFRALFANPTQLLTNGNTGTIEVPVHYDSATVVPASSTFEQQGQVFVYTLNENQEATPKKITVKKRTDNLVVVTEGVKPGDQIIAKGVGRIRNGMKVTPQPIPFEEVNSFEPVFK